MGGLLEGGGNIIESWGRGRKDYSLNIEYATIPVMRSYQTRTHFTAYADNTSYAYMTIDMEPTYGGLLLYAPLESDDYVLYDVMLSYDSNVLIKAYFVLVNTETWTMYAYQQKFGYGRINFKFPKGFAIYKEIMPPYYPGVYYLPGGYKVRLTMTLMRSTL